MINANDPNLRSWIPVDKDSDFPIQNIPFGIGRPNNKSPRPLSRIGDFAIDMSVLSDYGFFDDLEIENYGVFYTPVLNDLMELGKPIWKSVRNRISEIFREENHQLQDDQAIKNEAVIPIAEVSMLLPVEIGDYTDFYSSVEHATNVGKMFRDPQNALLPNWKHIPVGYHGRSSSIVASGTNIHRPKGQFKLDTEDTPQFGPTRLFDFELEIAFITGKKTQLGDTIQVENAEDYIFGLVIFNDLTARDIQKWEYVPLGPFLGKNFGSVVSPWIITLEALEPFRTNGPKQEPEVLPYLKFEGERNFDIDLEVYIKPENTVESLVCSSNMKYLYWNMSQQLAHHTVNGCNINPGDMYASGTISGTTPDSYGSMLEISWKGTRPITLKDGAERKFINDNDSIIMKAYANKNGVRIGFGDCITKVLPTL